jgi:hypothetical protein
VRKSSVRFDEKRGAGGEANALIADFTEPDATLDLFVPAATVTRPVLLGELGGRAVLFVPDGKAREHTADYKRIGSSFLALAKADASDEHVRQFAERFGRFPLSRTGIPSAPETHCCYGPQPVNAYRELARFVRGLIALREQQRISVDDLRTLGIVLTAWGGAAAEQLARRPDWAARLLVPDPTQIGEWCGEMAGKACGQAVVSVNDSARLAAYGCNLWLSIAAVTPHLTIAAGGNCVMQWSGGSWGVIGKMLLDRISGPATVREVRCPHCLQLYRPQRMPTIGQPHCCRKKVCRRERDRQYHAKSRDERRVRQMAMAGTLPALVDSR